MDYKFGTKNNWRRWMWNRIAERVETPSEALVLFLAGEQMLDIDVAASKGFQRRNMLAVERDPDVLRRLRASGVLVIDGDICDVLASWPLHVNVGVVVADFCCGLERKVLEAFAKSWFFGAFAKCVMAVNMLRGREGALMPIRRSWGGSLEAQKHRGVLLYEISLRAAAFHIVPPSKSGFYTEADKREVLWLMEHFDRVARPVTMTYRSSVMTQRFDSVVYRTPSGALLDSVLPGWCELPRYRVAALNDPQTAQARRIAAVLAHRTRRVNG